MRARTQAVHERKPKGAAEDVADGRGPKRNEHNDAVRRDRDLSEAHRAIYLKHHLDKLKPFITPQVGSS